MFLGALAFLDLQLWWRNPAPQQLTIEEAQNWNGEREWLNINNAWWDVGSAISTSGTLDLEGLLIPLRRADETANSPITILLETRDPELLALFAQYHFSLDNEQSKAEFLKSNADKFRFVRPAAGMVLDGFLARNSKSNLKQLAKTSGLAIADKVIFVTEHKEPAKWRGIFFAVVALLGGARLFFTRKK